MPKHYATSAHARVEDLLAGDIIRFMDEGEWVDAAENPAPATAIGGWLKVEEDPTLTGVNNSGRLIKVSDNETKHATAQRRRYAVVEVLLP